MKKRAKLLSNWFNSKSKRKVSALIIFEQFMNEAESLRLQGMKRKDIKETLGK